MLRDGFKYVKMHLLFSSLEAKNHDWIRIDYQNQNLEINLKGVFNCDQKNKLIQ